MNLFLDWFPPALVVSAALAMLIRFAEGPVDYVTALVALLIGGLMVVCNLQTVRG